MKSRPDGFLADDRIDHDGEIFDYIVELHDYLWRFIRAVRSPGADGRLGSHLDAAIETLESMKIWDEEK